MEENHDQIDDLDRDEWLDEYEQDLAGCVPGN